MTKNTGCLYCLLFTVSALCLCTSPNNVVNTGGNQPSAPVISSAIAGNGSVTVSWGGVTGATSYNLYYTAGTSVTKSTGTKATAMTAPMQITGLTNGTTYAFAASAVNTAGESGLSNVATARPETSAVIGTTIVMKDIPAGTFTMGSDSSEDYASPTHQVTLSAFKMSETDVTQEQYQAVMDTNPSYFDMGTGASLRPVEQVSWYDAVKYCNALSLLSGLTAVYDTSAWTADFSKTGYRLPTEAQWEYACRAGSTTEYWWGPDTNGMGARTWSWYNSGGTTQPVATKLPNAYGLYDMTGNVWQWCNDWDGGYTAGAATDPTGPAAGTCRVLRGGSWNLSGVDSVSVGFRSAFRSCDDPDYRNGSRGFRVVLPR